MLQGRILSILAPNRLRKPFIRCSPLPDAPRRLKGFCSSRGKVSLYWLEHGDGHEFLQEAADTVRRCAHLWLDEREKRLKPFPGYPG